MDLRERVIERLDNLFNYLGGWPEGTGGSPFYGLIANIVEVVVKDERAEAWDEGWTAAREYHALFHRPTNPYRS